MANLNMMDTDLANINIMDEEEDPMEVVGDDIAIDLEYGLCLGKEPFTIPLWTVVFLVHIHNLPVGFITEGMARQFGDFIGEFMEYDASLVTRGISKFMQIRVVIDIRILLKRKKRVGGTGSVRRFVRHIRKPIDIRIEDRMGQLEKMGDGSELKDMLVEFVDGKK
ncbi:hypothetical protein Goshw_027685 [Gossypium schwendimanii]|uniref:DUF4283 domain-containing protein n=1 Tax=Gossypium schwendimanii TaxID=34291 RepID=A0A7J9MEV6_GOSSC|nr:hypothetical protein [Gossypium schwendimanii]